MIKKTLVFVLAIVILLLGFGSKFSWLKKIEYKTTGSEVERNPRVLERYKSELYSLDDIQINTLMANGNFNKGDLIYKIIDITEDLSGNIKIYLVEVINEADGPGLMQSEGIIAVDKGSNAKLIDFDSVWGYFHHAKDFSLNMKTHDIKEIISYTDDGPVLSIHKNTFVNHGMAEYFDKYLVTESGFSHLGGN